MIKRAIHKLYALYIAMIEMFELVVLPLQRAREVNMFKTLFSESVAELSSHVRFERLQMRRNH